MQRIFFNTNGYDRSRRFRGLGMVLLVVLSISGITEYALSHAAGETGNTNKSTDSPGCSCHCANASSATTVTLTTSATTFETSTSYTFTISVSNSGESKAGCNIAVQRGSLAAGTGLKKSGSQLTHSTPKTLPASWTFTYTTPSTAGSDTIFAVGNAVNGNGSSGSGNCSDNWNLASKFVITVVSPNTKTLTYSRVTVPMGNLRVGTNKTDTMYLQNTGTATVSLSSQSMKIGTDFSNTPNSSATISASSTELQTITFSPKSKGKLSDSLIFQSDASTTYQGLYVSGTGIQAVFAGDSTGGTNAVDFLKVPLGTSKTVTYSFRNDGDDTLFLSSPSLTGAVTSMFSIMTQPAKVIPPGGNSSLDLKFTPPGHQAYAVTLVMTASNGVTVPQIAVVGSGAAPAIYAKDTIDLGASRVGVALTADVAVSNTGDTALHVTSAAVLAGQQGTRFSVVGAPVQTIGTNTSGLVSIKYTPTNELGDTATVSITSDDQTLPTKQITVIARGIAPHMSLAVSDTIDFGDVGVGSTATSPALGVTNTGKYQLLLSAVTATPNNFTVVGAPKSVGVDSTSTFAVDFKPTTPGSVKGQVIVRSDDASNPSDTIYLIGNGVKANVVFVSKIDFGSRIVASLNDTTIVIRNAGNAPIAIKSFSLANPSNVFSLTDTLTHTIAASDSAVIGLRFSPLAGSSYMGSITFVTDEASTNKHTIQLAGAGMIDNASVVDVRHADALLIWPNPASNTASLSLRTRVDRSGVTVTFIDALGRQVGMQSLGSLSVGSHVIALKLPAVSGPILVRVSAVSILLGSSRIVLTR
jgi:hypothetical protein